MAEYIDREALLEEMQKHRPVFSSGLDGSRERLAFLTWHSCLNAIKTFPAANVRPVVLCRDCEMASPCTDDREVYCTLNHCYKKKSYFCADGKGEK